MKHLHILLFLLFALCGISVHAAYEDPASLPDPMKEYNNPGFVCNPDGLLTPDQVASLNAKLRVMERTSTVETAVVVVNSIGDEDPFDYADELGKLWKIGKKSNDNGLIILVVMDTHNIRFSTGYGLEGVLPDAVCSEIIENDMVPQMRRGNLYGALMDGVSEVARIVSDDKVAAEVRGKAESKLKQRTERNKQRLYMLAGIFVTVMFVVCVYTFFRTWRNSRKERADWYGRSKVWRKSLMILLCLGVLSAGAGLIFFLWALWRYRYWRTRRRRCPNCNHKMKRLGEEEDNAYLTSAQDAEERLGTVDYDVWLCPQCGEVDIYAFEKEGTKYEKCPACGAKAYLPVSERIVRRPTASMPGVGVRTRRCMHCGHTDDENFDIPREEGGGSAAGSLIAGAALGALLSGGRGGGGGNFGGGGWGGGSFGGGGASGSW